MAARWAKWIVLAACVAFASPAAADPQWSIGVVPGFCVVHSSRRSDPCFYGSVRGDVLFARHRGGDWGLGPSVELATLNFDDLRLNAAASLLLPVAAFPLVISAGPSLIHNQRTRFAAATRLFWGFREYNHLGTYGAATGLLFGWDYGVGAKNEQCWLVSVQLDAMWLSLPFLAAYMWARGPS